MCTAITMNGDGFYFGRTLDYEFSYGDCIAMTPRNFRFGFSSAKLDSRHYAMMGMAHIANGIPLYYEAMNEKGLGMAGLNFVDYAHYGEPRGDKINLPPHEFIPYVLGLCKDLSEARKLLANINLIDRGFSEDLPVAQLHWIIADESGALTVESTAHGFNVYENCVGVLTNNPEFPQQMLQLNNYMNLSAKPPVNNFCSGIELRPYSRGMGAIGLPGDLSSESRFARVAFFKSNSVCGEGENASVSQFFHVLGGVDTPRGSCDIGNGVYQITRYTCCCDCTRGIYYYTTYGNHRISAVNMNRENLDGDKLKTFPQIENEQINWQN
ncbi:MAG: choloylglycine hydrolase [Oscillospiraceae bacterium]|nr:choloylglycine hydrolase [Oscillospiraceae bacterium]